MPSLFGLKHFHSAVARGARGTLRAWARCCRPGLRPGVIYPRCVMKDTELEKL